MSRRDKEFYVAYWGLCTTVKALSLNDAELDALYAQGLLYIQGKSKFASI